MGKIANSWGLVKQSFGILRQDKELMLLPVLSAISCILVTVVIVGGGSLAAYPFVKDTPSGNQIFSVVALFVFYLVNYFVIVFFNTALVGAASIRLSGGNPTLRDGLQLAWERKGVILQWAALAATVGVILKLIEQRAKLLGRIVARVIGLAWSLASYFVVPILAFEKLGPIDALKRSAELFRKTWGEQVAGGVSIGLIFFLLALPGILFPVAGFLLSGTAAVIGLALMVLYFLFLAVLSSAVSGIYTAALYRFVTKGEVSQGFTQQNFSMAWQRR